ncbi:hypothetical protein CHUAL_014207 [Chamberlinius hualienensis]
MKRTLFTTFLVVGACVISIAVSAPTTSAPASSNKAVTTAPKSKTVDDAKKKVVAIKSGKSGEINADDSNIRRKKSEEFIQFGNQQNKPAGMVDDALSGIATKKNLDMTRNRPNFEDGQQDELNEDESGAENEPLSSLMGSDNKGGDGPYGDDSELDTSTYMGSAAIPMESSLEEGQSSFRDLREQSNDRFNGEWFDRGDGYNNRRRRNILRNDRSFRKRSLRATAEKLMNMRGGAKRWKRDVRLHEDDLLGFLSLMAAAELAKEKEEKQRELERLPFPGVESDFAWPPRNGYLDDDQPLESYGIGPDNYGYYYPGQNFDVDVISKIIDNKESPELVMLNPGDLAMDKRNLYPAVDYRSLGIIGARKRRPRPQLPIGEMSDESADSASLYGGNWGRIRETMPNLRQLVGEYNDDSESPNMSDRSGSDEVDFGGHNQELRDKSESDKLYSLGELLNGVSEVEDYRYPIYRRLI